jgi:ABC-type oligopeptide transport system substrate-binding subunit
MLENVGIKINIYKLKESDLSKKIESGEYDLVLTNVYINDNPNISYLNNFININNEINNAIMKVNESSIDELSNNIKNLQNTISSEIACIGIVARNTNVVYQKYITGFDEISYMNVFRDIDKIGKIIQ